MRNKQHTQGKQVSFPPVTDSPLMSDSTHSPPSSHSPHSLISREAYRVAEEGDRVLSALRASEEDRDTTEALLGRFGGLEALSAEGGPAKTPQELLRAYITFYHHKEAGGGESAFFSAPKDRLDPTLWENDDKLRDDVTEAMVSTWTATYEPMFNGLLEWSRLVLIGSGTSYQYGTHEDADVNWIIDWELFLKDNPDFEGEWRDLRAVCHHTAAATIDGTILPGGQPWQIFIRLEQNFQDFYAKARYMAQGCWDILAREWIIDPIKIDWGFKPSEAFNEWEPDAEAAISKAEDLLEVNSEVPSEESVQNIKDFYQWLHDGRQSGFSDPGMGGQWSRGNFIWQSIEQAGLMEPIKEVAGGYLLSSKEASYADVRAKASQIYQSGGVEPIKLTPDFSEANITSTSGQTYYNVLKFDPNTPKIIDWVCECPWSKWNYDRAPEYSYLEHRKCAHSLAHLYYLQAFVSVTQPYFNQIQEAAKKFAINSADGVSLEEAMEVVSGRSDFLKKTVNTPYGDVEIYNLHHPDNDLDGPHKYILCHVSSGELFDVENYQDALYLADNPNEWLEVI